MEPAVGSSALVNVVVLCGSLRQSSYHRGLIRAAIQISKDSVKEMNIEFVDISPLPFLNTDLEVAGTFPPVVEAFREKIRQADCYLFASPEYNYSVTGWQERKDLHFFGLEINGKVVAEVVYANILPTVIVDFADAALMNVNRVNAVIVGSDHVAANGASRVKTKWSMCKPIIRNLLN